MSYTPEDAAWDEALENISQELYPEHKEQAIEEFTNERLQSYYLSNPEILVPAVRMYHMADNLKKSYPSASLVFSTTAIELFLKAALLKPVVYGLVHIEPLAEIVMEVALRQSSFDRYKKLLSPLFKELTGIDISNIKRTEFSDELLKEVKEIQTKRNTIIHQGAEVSDEDAKHALDVAHGVFFYIVLEMLNVIGLKINDDSKVVRA